MKAKELIGSALLVSSVALGANGLSTINDSYAEEASKEVKSLVGKILSQSDSEKKVSIYNPQNPDGIKTDDGYIYIV